jgi:hypothetical protein
MKFSNVILRTVAVFIAVSIAQMLAGAFVSLLLRPTIAIPALPQHMMQWMILSNAVTVVALSILAARSEWRNWKLGIAVAAIPLAVTLIDGIEGVYFLPHSPIDWSRIFIQTAIAAALSVPAWMLLFGRRPPIPQDHYHPIATKSWNERAWKFVVCDFAYLVLYFTAGSIIWPYIKDFYAMQTLPSMSMILVLELLVRGPALILLCLMMTRMLGLSRLQGALAVGVIFTVLSGIAPLLIPNPYFPDVVRWAHFCEVTSSNFVFGALVAWLWGPPARTAVLVAAAA